VIVITLARKPLTGTVATNAEKHGTGGINIDGCRIGVTKGWLCSRNHTPGFMAGGMTGIFQDANQDVNRSLGRWPANLILEHKLGCRCLGDKVVLRGGGTPQTKVFKPSPTLFAFGPRPSYTPYGNGDGTKTVSAWECEPGCPVAEMNKQSGYGGNSFRTSRNHQGGVLGWRAGNGLGFDDEGFASRFFHQVQGPSGKDLK